MIPCHDTVIISRKPKRSTAYQKPLSADDPVLHRVGLRVADAPVHTALIELMQLGQRPERRLPCALFKRRQLFFQRLICDEPLYKCILYISSLVGKIIRCLQDICEGMPVFACPCRLSYLAEDLLVGQIISHLLLFDIPAAAPDACG